jgi:hypothetical protein
VNQATAGGQKTSALHWVGHSGQWQSCVGAVGSSEPNDLLIITL